MQVYVSIATYNFVEAVELNLECLLEVFKQGDIEHNLFSAPLYVVYLVLVIELYGYQKYGAEEGHAALVGPLHETETHKKRVCAILLHHCACCAAKLFQCLQCAFFIEEAMDATVLYVVLYQVYHVHIQLG